MVLHCCTYSVQVLIGAVTDTFARRADRRPQPNRERSSRQERHARSHHCDAVRESHPWTSESRLDAADARSPDLVPARPSRMPERARRVAWSWSGDPGRRADGPRRAGARRCAVRPLRGLPWPRTGWTGAPECGSVRRLASPARSGTPSAHRGGSAVSAPSRRPTHTASGGVDADATVSDSGATLSRGRRWCSREGPRRRPSPCTRGRAAGRPGSPPRTRRGTRALAGPSGPP